MISDLLSMICITVKVPVVVHLAVCNVVSTLGVTLVTHNSYQGTQILLTGALSPGAVESGQDLVPPVPKIQSVEPENSEDALLHLVSPNSSAITTQHALNIEGSVYQSC